MVGNNRVRDLVSKQGVETIYSEEGTELLKGVKTNIDSSIERTDGITTETISNIEPEILWREEQNILNTVILPENMCSCGITTSDGKEMEVFFENSDYFEELKEKFPLSAHPEKIQGVILPKLYFISKEEGQAYGQVDTKNQIAVVTSRDLFGILKSEIAGFSVSQEKEDLPFHGAVFSSEGTGTVAAIGARGTGKTTMVLDFLNRFSEQNKEFNFITDDFASIETDGTISTPDNSISISEKTITEHPQIESFSNEEILERVKKRKISCRPSELFAKVGNITNLEKIDTLVLLVKGVKEPITTLMPEEIEDEYLDLLIEYIIKCTYHYPYISHELIIAHRLKWKNLIMTLGINIILFDHTHYSNIQESHNSLHEELKNTYNNRKEA